MDKPIRISETNHAEGRWLHTEFKKAGLGFITHDQIYKAGLIRFAEILKMNEDYAEQADRDSQKAIPPIREKWRKQ